jgi:KUP system potassium uptake protein
MSVKRKRGIGATLALTIGALGVVYGDIGTSPLYAFSQSAMAAGGGREAILGVLSLIFWTVILVVCVKYLVVVMSVDNHGEGGILALFALLPAKIRSAKSGRLGLLVFLVLLAAAFVFADGLLTPAISVISAVEGLKSINPSFGEFVIPVTVVILTALFVFQFKGTKQIGLIFGPIMVLWFITLAALGLSQALGNPEVWQALNPGYAIEFVMHHGWRTLWVMSFIILCITGVEALYADLGHFGKTPIRISWFGLVGISLVLNYFGQGALALREPNRLADSFFAMAGSGLPAILLVCFSTIATIIASQALISGVASLASQAIQLGLLPRLKVNHTNEGHRGQIYVPLVNALLGSGSIALVLIFESSARLADAYSFAIAGTMLITTLTMFWVAKDRWKVPSPLIAAGFAMFGIFDLALFVACTTKIVTGAWLPLLIGFCVASMMWIWRKGRRVLYEQLSKDDVTVAQIKRMRTQGRLQLTKGLGIYLGALPGVVPQALQQQVKVLRSMPEKIVIVTVIPIDDPYSHEPPHFEKVNEWLSRVTVEAGFMQPRNLPRVLKSKSLVNQFDEKQAIYYVAERSLVQKHTGSLNRLEEIIFDTLHRNASNASRYYKLPVRRVITFDVGVDI